MTFDIETERLNIIEPDSDALADWTKLLSDPDVMKYIGDGVPRSPEACLDSLQMAMKHLAKYGYSIGSVYEKESGEFIGRAGMIHVEYNDASPDIEVGYALHKDYWGRGYATELTIAIIEWAFANTDLVKLVGITYPENLASQKVLLKSGMQHMGKSTAYNQEVEWFEIERRA